MAQLSLITTEVFFNVPGVTRTSLLVTTLTSDPAIIKAEAVHKAKVCYGLDIHDMRLGSQFFK